MRRSFLTAFAGVLAVIVSLIGVSAAQAVVVSDQGTFAGVTLLPGGTLPAGVTPVTASGPCTDPALSLDLSLGGSLHVLPPNGLCYHGGPVMRANETFAITWDPNRAYWQTTRDYVEQFLRDVADGSGTLTSPYAVTTQYTETGVGRAANASLYGGGCIDYGNPGGSSCVFGNAVKSGPGTNYSNGCPLTGSTVCVTDAQLQGELTTMVNSMGMVGRTEQGATPLLVMLLPQGVKTCLDASGTLCSANAGASGAFCSYHSYIVLPDGTRVPYVVQPWTFGTGCDEADLPTNPNISIYAGMHLVSPLSAGQIAAIVNPTLNGWVANDGAETSDNLGCRPDGYPTDAVVVGGSAQNPYFLQPEFSNSGVLESDPNAPACALGVALSPTFVVPSPIDHGDVVAFDGSTAVSSLIVPAAGYQWDFGDGSKGVGPSVVHSFAKGGTYAVKLTVTDRGGNQRSVTETITVLGPSGGPSTPTSGLRANIQLMPQGLKTVLRSGVALKVISNAPADGIATLTIPRSAARRAHLNAGRGPAVVIGRGTVSGIKLGTTRLRLHLSRAVAAKLARLTQVVMTVQLKLVGPGGQRFAIDVAGQY